MNKLLRKAEDTVVHCIKLQMQNYKNNLILFIDYFSGVAVFREARRRGVRRVWFLSKWTEFISRGVIFTMPGMAGMAGLFIFDVF